VPICAVFAQKEGMAVNPPCPKTQKPRNWVYFTFMLRFNFFFKILPKTALLENPSIPAFASLQQ